MIKQNQFDDVTEDYGNVITRVKIRGQVDRIRAMTLDLAVIDKEILFTHTYQIIKSVIIRFYHKLNSNI